MKVIAVVTLAFVGFGVSFDRPAPVQQAPQTPGEMVAAYGSLADSILALNLEVI